MYETVSLLKIKGSGIGFLLGKSLFSFDRDNKLVKTLHKRFPGHMRRQTSQFNSNSWVVGNFTIDP